MPTPAAPAPTIAVAVSPNASTTPPPTGGHADLAVTASTPDPQRYGFADLETERQMLVAAPTFAARAKGRSVTADFLSALPSLAYDETLPLIRPYFEHVFGEPPDMQAAATAPDLRILLGLAEAGTGWTVLPDYICADALATGRLVELPTVKPGPDNRLYLVWNKAALRHPRVVHVRDRLLQAIGRASPVRAGDPAR
ncbi:substrate-binding domain-containing protein [Methylobacterium sp. E-066]|uniref:substrate-binding domain-containing protein n=1 Tax=Methylobacterium sp. E-066 TaxID=2836584 RepID=UPI001FBB654D|nr:substrate-binding domain-containing protein [Methylobacterium sp. E-066]MCJ2139152.1 substrate-binding domain-containing protein [Methylobacterium sp. E-066]